ncbi:MAG: PAS domain-containing sensor histidine kinase, partial [Euryarchaeota archaeon]|nr:PAS domain-containing sensor histidine kinase [Euryarchaeota archaeon]
LRESEERFRSVAQSANDAIISSDGHGKIVFWNDAAKKIFGYESSEVLGKQITILMREKYREDHNKVMERIRTTGESHIIGKTVELHALRKDGSEFPMEISLSSWKTGEKIFFSAIMRDITERRRNEGIQRENERLALANRAKSNFLMVMSHELRTPLNAIIGFTELLKKKEAGDLNQKQQRYADNVHLSGKNLLRIIDDLLDLTRVESGKMEFTIEHVSVPVAVNEVLENIKEKAGKQKIIIKKDLGHEIEFIDTDGQKFRQVLNNLLDNAVKFSKPEGGTVTITAEKEGDMAKFSVADNGIGINEENMGRLFHSFEQLDSGIARKYGGTGLGLAVSKKLVELLGGRIMAQSRYGEGSTFTFYLPVAAKKEGLI